ncbi:hypothetical protein BGY98DRAFT_932935 [Russula aff. rugulosa BPL654]|nr:hypothetical protein BGY98DRAFT_932935 [Russula aff. rugulosa BPL654]
MEFPVWNTVVHGPREYSESRDHWNDVRPTVISSKWHWDRAAALTAFLSSAAQRPWMIPNTLPMLPLPSARPKSGKEAERKMSHRLKQQHMQMGQTHPTIRKFLRRKVVLLLLLITTTTIPTLPVVALCGSTDVLEVRWGFKSRCVTIIVLVSPEIERKGRSYDGAARRALWRRVKMSTPPCSSISPFFSVKQRSWVHYLVAVVSRIEIEVELSQDRSRSRWTGLTVLKVRLLWCWDHEALSADSGNDCRSRYLYSHKSARRSAIASISRSKSPDLSLQSQQRRPALRNGHHQQIFFLIVVVMVVVPNPTPSDGELRVSHERRGLAMDDLCRPASLMRDK